MPEALGGAIGVVMQPVEKALDFHPRGAGEVIRELQRFRRVQVLRVAARAADRKELRCEIDEAREEQFLLLQLRAMQHQRVKQRPRQPMRSPRAPAHVRRESRAEIREKQPEIREWPEPLTRILARIFPRRRLRRLEALLPHTLRVEHRRDCFPMPGDHHSRHVET